MLMRITITLLLYKFSAGYPWFTGQPDEIDSGVKSWNIQLWVTQNFDGTGNDPACKVEHLDPDRQLNSVTEK